MINKIDKNIPDFLLSPEYRVYRHLLLQLAIMCITSSVFADLSGELLATRERFYCFIGFYLVLNLDVYCNLYLLAPRYLMKDRIFSYILSVVGLILFSVVFISVLQNYFYHFNEMYPEQKPYVVLNILSSMISIGLLTLGSSTLLLIKYWIGYNQRVDELASSTLQSELKFLKKQINPHFLFNMLNNANVLIRKNPKEASRVLFRLKDLLRYQINDSAKEKVLLDSEIQFLNDYLNLEKIRRDKFEYFIFKEGKTDRVWLPPLLFIPFVENAVKHNLDAENKSFVYLSFEVEDNNLLFRCQNSKPAIRPERDGVGGLGLKNIRRRLELLFPDNYSLEIQEDEKTYTVNLHLTL